MTIAAFTLKRCTTCGLQFLPVAWLAWRAGGYCRARCVPHIRIVVPTGRIFLSSDGASHHVTRGNGLAEPAYPQPTHDPSGLGGSNSTGGSHDAMAPP
jgi:hypothetical protein